MDLKRIHEDLKGRFKQGSGYQLVGEVLNELDVISLSIDGTPISRSKTILLQCRRSTDSRNFFKYLFWLPL